jgi:hypothetical protein
MEIRKEPALGLEENRRARSLKAKRRTGPYVANCQAGC